MPVYWFEINPDATGARIRIRTKNYYAKKERRNLKKAERTWRNR